MSASISLNTAFAIVLAAQTETVGSARSDALASNATATKLDTTTLLATLDPTRAAFASTLLGLDVAHAPQVAGPYSPNAVSGPLTEDDIFDPSNIYSLPAQELVVSEGSAQASTAALVASVRPESEAVSAGITSHDLGANSGGAFNNDEAGHPGGATPQPGFAAASGSKPPLDQGLAASLEGRPSTLTLELVVAGYMSLRQAGLPTTQRKLLRRLTSRATSMFDDWGWGAPDTSHDEDPARRRS